MKLIDKTWENSAEIAVDSIYSTTIQNGFQSPDMLCRFIRLKFDQSLNSIENYSNIPDDGLSTENSGLWNFIGRHALMILRSQGYFPAKEHVVSTLISKQKDYGPENIARFGNIGLLIRMHDKIARLENILAKTKNNFNTAINVNSVSNETIIDTLIDIVGYSAIAIMWSTIDENGQRCFLHPMSS
jgi:hypothetical protein